MPKKDFDRLIAKGQAMEKVVEAARYVKRWMEERPTLSHALDTEVKREAYKKLTQALADLDAFGGR